MNKIAKLKLKVKTYPLFDPPTETERAQFGDAAIFAWAQRGSHEGVFLRAVQSGECRRPRKGEWYLSGAIVEAYRAPNDLSTVYQIAKLVVIERVVIERIITEN